jgi:hypothetical protein
MRKKNCQLIQIIISKLIEIQFSQWKQLNFKSLIIKMEKTSNLNKILHLKTSNILRWTMENL